MAVFQMVKALRAQRPGSVTTVVHIIVVGMETYSVSGIRMEMWWNGDVQSGGI